MISGSGADLQCVLPCDGSGECDCLTNWDVTPMSDMNEVMMILQYMHTVIAKCVLFRYL